MTRQQFNAECEKRTIHPAIALDNPDIVMALLHDDDNEVVRILNEEF